MSMISSKEFTFDRVIRILIGITIALLFFLLVSYVKDVLIPFVIAVIIAYMLYPITIFYEKRLKIKSRFISIVLTFITVLLFVGLLVSIVIPQVVSEINRMYSIIADLVKNAGIEEKRIDFIPEQVWDYIKSIIVSKEFQSYFEIEKLSEYGIQLLKTVFPSVVGIFSGALSVLGGILGIFFIMLYLIFILIDYEKFSDGWDDLLPESIRGFSVGLLSDFTNAMSTYFRAQAVIAFCVGVLFAIGFSIIGLPLGIILGLLIGLMNMVPYLQNLAIPPALFLAIIKSIDTGQNFWVIAGLVLMVFAIVQFIQDGLLTPKIMGQALGLNPAIILLSLSIWGKLLGFLGLVIALPMTLLVYSYYNRFMLEKKTNILENQTEN